MVEEVECAGRFTTQNLSGEIGHGLFARESEHVEHVILPDLFSAESDELIEHRFRIAQAALGAARDCMRSRRLQRDFFFSGNELEMLRNQICRDTMEIEPLTAAQNRRQNFLRLGRRENKFHMRRRFLERFKQRVERGRGQHVHFVDDVDFVARLGRRVADIFAQLAHLLDAVVARAVDFQNVERIAGGDFLAVIARAVRIDRRPFLAIERFGQNTGGRSLSDPARTDE